MPSSFRGALLALPLLIAGAAAGFAQSDPLARAPSRFAEVGGLKIHYKSLHTGRIAVVFVHGWASDLNAWRLQAPVLEERVRMVALDLPGHGRSDKPAGPYSMDLMARAVNGVMETAGVDRAVLVGHSLGTPVIRQFYRLYPKKAIALVVVDGTLKPPGLDSAAIERQVRAFSGPDLPQIWERMIAPMFPGPSLDDARRQVLRTARATPPHVVTAVIRGMMDPAIWRDDPIQIPVLAVMAKGPSWPPEYLAYVRNLVPGLQYEELDGVHHFLMLERPDLFNPLLVDFLKAQGVFDR